MQEAKIGYHEGPRASRTVDMLFHRRGKVCLWFIKWFNLAVAPLIVVNREWVGN